MAGCRRPVEQRHAASGLPMDLATSRTLGGLLTVRHVLDGARSRLHRKPNGADRGFQPQPESDPVFFRAPPAAPDRLLLAANVPYSCCLLSFDGVS